MKPVVAVPSYRGARWLPFLLASLALQSESRFTCFFLVKPSGDGSEEIIRKASETYGLDAIVAPQRRGSLDTAVNVLLRAASRLGDPVIVVDDDVILPPYFVEAHRKLHEAMPSAGGFAGKVYYIDVSAKPWRITRVEEERNPFTLLEKHLLSKLKPCLTPELLWYRRGVFLDALGSPSWGSRVAGSKPAPSLLWRGCNISLKAGAVKDLVLPTFTEHTEATRGYACWEQLLGLALVLKGYHVFYTPIPEVYHIVRESTSRKKSLLSQLTYFKGFIASSRLARAALRAYGSKK